MNHNLNFVNQSMLEPLPLKIHTGSLLDNLDKETLQRVLEEPYMRYPLVLAKPPIKIQKSLMESGYLDLIKSRFIRVKTARGAKLGSMGTIQSGGYITIQINKTKYLQSHLVYLWFTGVLPRYKEEIDHIDGNPSNDYPGNLRLVSRLINCRNSRMHLHNSSGYAGVSYNVNAKKYRSYIIVNKKQVYIGIFNTAKEAYIARQVWIENHPELGFTARHGG
jgi:hypothetical protein